MSYFAKIRFYTAFISAWLMNLNVFGISLRKICAPGFNCHGCPWATASCPVGVLAFSSAIHQLPLLAISSVLAVGVISGRMVCGFICPFGFIQDLISRIPVRKFNVPRFFRYGKYLFLVFLVFLLPWILGFEYSGYLYLPKPVIAKREDSIDVSVKVRNIGDRPVVEPRLDFVFVEKAEGSSKKLLEHSVICEGLSVAPGEELEVPPETLPNMLSEADLLVSSPQSRPEQTPRYKLYFCTHCPNGTLTASLPAVLAGKGGQGIYSSGVFSLRYLILALFLVSAVLVTRIFCRIACPLGAMYALLSRFSAFGKISVRAEGCVNCGRCSRGCPMGLDVRKEAGTMECISCGDCISVCPAKCISRQGRS